ncbi:IS4 family transposase [Candidatus Chloroploca sp. Khr17]|uniref:IS4 family transposase n=1 Tax=Candidatus Chloroploca sp. Khr17 TaxID=2496869 RepID=UPI0013EB5939|nr:IS4 family transposase [Candidatus Chloroploca sp. Khr17]
MREVLDEVAKTVARACGVIQRERVMHGAHLVQTLVFGWLANPDATLDDLVAMAKVLGITISKAALCKRFTDALVTCMERVLQHAMGTLVAADPVAIPLLARFSEVLLQDSTTISLPASLAQRFRGCGGRNGAGQAALKAQVRLEMRTGMLEGPLVQDGRASDRAVAFRRRPGPGSLSLRDLSYFQLDELALDTREKRFWINRLKPNTAIFCDGVRVDLLTMLRQEASDAHTTLDIAVQIGVAQRIACRLLVVRVPEQTAAQRLRRLHREMRKKGRTASAEQEAWCGWTVFVTNMPTDMVTLTEALVLMRLRWQIELLFKLWKSHGKVDESRGQRDARVLTEIYAKFIGMIMQHWLLLTGCWQKPDRSLPKVAKKVREFAKLLAQAMHHPRTLRKVVRLLMEEISKVEGQTPRTKEPNAYQLLLNPNLLEWAVS